MSTRIKTSTVVFARPFVLDEIERELPAGSYMVEVEEEMLDGVSFVGYRRVGTRMTIPLLEEEAWKPGSSGRTGSTPRCSGMHSSGMGRCRASRDPPVKTAAAIQLRRHPCEACIMQPLNTHENRPLYGVLLGVLAMLFASWVAGQFA